LSFSRAQAVPPAAMAASSSRAKSGLERWITHRVIPGERIAEIAERYGVDSKDVLEWNEIDQAQPMIRINQELRIKTRSEARDRVRERYKVKRGDSWSTIASKFGARVTSLRDVWNRGHGELRPGDKLLVFREREPETELEDEAELEVEAAPTPKAAAALAAVVTSVSKPKITLPEPEIVQGGFSVGAPDRGRLEGGVIIPANDQLYSLRNPDHSYGSSHAVEQLQLAVKRFREQSEYDRELVIMDMSRRRGGRFRPHESHQSGRDVDIRLPIRQGVPSGTIPELASQVDWDAAWQLVHALIETGQVRYVFLTRQRQKLLYEAALRAGATREELEPLIQFPKHTRTAVVRHARDHTKHIHVRFLCGADETRCRD
jgi:murein endopeptidase/LysM repeat protein